MRWQGGREGAGSQRGREERGLPRLGQDAADSSALGVVELSNGNLAISSAHSRVQLG